MNDNGLTKGALNLLVNCAGVRSGERLLIVHEDPALGWYDDEAAQAVADQARVLGLSVTMMRVGGPAIETPRCIVDAIVDHDVVSFFARIGDQGRFDEIRGRARTVMSYARNATGLASAYGRTHHRAMVALKNAVNDLLFAAGHIEITCPLGTDISGKVHPAERESSADVTIRRFPLGVPQPVPAVGFAGRVALSRYLTPTGSQAYDPPTVAIDGTVFADVDAGRIVGFEGKQSSIAAIRDHYAHVASLFDIDPDCVHSWHAGIHPGCLFQGRIDDNPDCWSNNIFTHPRFLHFHTCGNYAPGEICWTLLDPTVRVDGIALWENGRLKPDAFEQTSAVVAHWPELAELIASPAEMIGLSA